MYSGFLEVPFIAIKLSIFALGSDALALPKHFPKLKHRFLKCTYILLT